MGKYWLISEIYLHEKGHKVEVWRLISPDYSVRRKGLALELVGSMIPRLDRAAIRSTWKPALDVREGHPSSCQAATMKPHALHEAIQSVSTSASRWPRQRARNSTATLVSVYILEALPPFLALDVLVCSAFVFAE